MMFKIPKDIFLEMKEYLEEYEYWKFLKTSKNGFKDLRFETRMIQLNAVDSNTVFRDQIYRRILFRKIKDPYQQLKLIFSEADESALPALLSFPSKALSLEEATHLTEAMVPALNNRSFVTLYNNDDLQSFTGLLNVRRMEICYFSSLINVMDLSCLKELRLACCDNISDVSCLKNLYKLELSDLYSLKNVNVLGNIPFLILDELGSVVDISGLTNNYSLEIKKCRQIHKDCFRALKYPTVLSTDLIQDTFQESFSVLSNTKSLTVLESNIPSFASFAFSSSLQSVSLIECHSVLTLNGLSCIPTIFISYCNYLEDISAISGQFTQSFTIQYCRSVLNFYSLKDIQKVTIVNCSAFRNGHDVENVAHCSLEYCDGLQDVSMLGKINHLQLLYCNNIIYLKGLSTVKKLLFLSNREFDTFEDQIGSEANEKITLSKKQFGIVKETFESNYDVIEEKYENIVTLIRKTSRHLKTG
jgi:hypothetical protein